MTGFVDSFSSQQLLPPWITKDARAWNFVVRASNFRFQAYLDSHFNRAAPDLAPFLYRALDDPAYGILCIVEHGNLSSGAIGTQGWDTVTTNEVSWTFPAQRWRMTPDNLAVDPEFVWIKPYMMVDNSYVMFSSREIWGDETEMAKIKVATGAAPDDMHIDVAIEAIKRFAPRARSHPIGYMHVQIEPGSAGLDLAALLARDSGLAAFNRFLSDHAQVDSAADLAVAPDRQTGMALNTLKQFRDVFDMRVAAYAALVAARATRSNVRDLVYYDGAKIALEVMWSDSSSEALTHLFGLIPPHDGHAESGHPAGGPQIDEHGIDWDMPRSPMPVAFGTSFTFDARFDVLETLHTYGMT